MDDGDSGPSIRIRSMTAYLPEVLIACTFFALIYWLVPLLVQKLFPSFWKNYITSSSKRIEKKLKEKKKKLNKKKIKSEVHRQFGLRFVAFLHAVLAVYGFCTYFREEGFDSDNIPCNPFDSNETSQYYMIMAGIPDTLSYPLCNIFTYQSTNHQ